MILPPKLSLNRKHLLVIRLFLLLANYTIETSFMANQDKAVFFNYPNHIRKDVDEPFKKEIVISSSGPINIEFWFRLDPKQDNELDRFFGIVSQAKPNDGFQYFFNYKNSSESITSGKPYFHYHYSGVKNDTSDFYFFELTKMTIDIAITTSNGVKQYLKNLKFNGVLLNGFPRFLNTSVEAGDEFTILIGANELSHTKSQR